MTACPSSWIRSGYDAWLDPGMQDLGAACGLLKPCDARLMRRYPVGTRINYVGNDDEQCCAPVEITQIQRREAAYTMSESKVIANQKTIIKNQKTIIANQGALRANQTTIKKNQASILKNQAAFSRTRVPSTRSSRIRKRFSPV
jgi:hypothetical protein